MSAKQYDKLSEGLDFNLVTIEDRMKLVNKIVEDNDKFLTNFYSHHYNPNISQTAYLSENTKVGKDLETLANYLLYTKDSEVTEDTLTDYKKKRNAIREASIEKIIKVKEFRKETNKSIYKTPKIKVTSKDRLEIEDLRQTGDVIATLTKMIKTSTDTRGKIIHPVELRKLKWIRTDIQKDEVAMKNDIKKYIKFQSMTKQDPDMNALSYIRFDDVEIIRILIEDYSELKEYSYEDTHGYLKIIMIAFEDLIDKTDIKDYMKDVLTWKIEGIQYDEMIVMLKDVHDVKMTKPRLSKITRETLPNMIVDTYKQQREDWVYTHVMKGEYKACSDCKENYLATTKYFNPDKTAKSGLRSVCKECRRKKYKDNASAKSVELLSK